MMTLTVLVGSQPAVRANANTICVNPSGSDGCYSTIQTAIDAASAGDTIHLQSGEYNESVLITKNLTLLGSGSASTVLDGQNLYPLITIGQDTEYLVPSVSLSAITIRRGHSSPFLGGGIINYGDLLIAESIITGNVAFSGGGIENFGTLSLDMVTLSDNIAIQNGAGIENRGTLLVLGSNFDHNMATNGYPFGLGGGIGNIGGVVTVTNSIFSNNISHQGAGIYFQAANNWDSAGSVDGSHFSYNQAYEGGGIYNVVGVVTVTNNTFTNNYSLGDGSAILSTNGGIVIQNTLFFSNTGGTTMRSNGVGTVSDTTFSQNQSDSILYVTDSANLSGITMTGNRQSLLALVADNATVNILNSTFSGGRSYGLIGHGSGSLNISNSTLVGTPSQNPVIENGYTSSGPLTIRNSIISSNGQSPRNCSGVIVSQGHNISSDSSCGLSGIGDLNNTSPLLAPLASYWPGKTQTYGLLFDSPAKDLIPLAACIDISGSPVLTDQRGIARPQGGNCDVGAFEGSLYPAYFPLIRW